MTVTPKPAFLLFIFLFALVIALSQNRTGSLPELLRQYRAADALYQRALQVADRSEVEADKLNKYSLRLFESLLEKLPYGPDSLKFFALYKSGELHHYFENYPQALRYYRDAIAVKNYQVADSFLFKPVLYSGIIYYTQNELDSATMYFDRAEKLLVQYNGRLEEAERLYNNLGVMHHETGNYQQAKNYFKKAVSVLSPRNPSYRELYINYNINLAQIHYRLEEYDEANAIYQRLLPYKIFLNEIYHNLGNINLSLGAPGKALTYFRKASFNNARKIRLFNGIGNAFASLQQFDSARKYFDSSIAVHHLFRENGDAAGLGLTYKSLGDLEKEVGQPLLALRYYQQALHLFYPSFTDTSVHSNPSKFSGVFSYINLFNTLSTKADAFHQLYTQSGRLDWAQKELDTYRSAFQLISYVEQTYDSDEARLFLANYKYAVHSKPIDIAFELYKKTGDKKYLEELYLLDQQNKASVLAFNQQLSAQVLKSTSPLVKNEQELKSRITRLSLRASLLSDSLVIDSLSGVISELEIRLGKIQNELAKILDLDGNVIPSIRDVQQMLKPDQGVVSYHLSAEKLTTFVIRSDSFQCTQKDLDANFHQDVEQYIRSLRETSDGIAPYSKRLYDLLIPPLQVATMIIIPDDELNYLAFESLQDSSGRYLVEQTAVQYHYATSMLKKEKSKLSPHATLAFAPFATRSSGAFKKLAESRTEIDGLAGTLFLDTAATKRNFLDNINGHDVIHLATHAMVNPEKGNLSYIAFSPGPDTLQSFLYAQEIYNLSLQKTQLVILSACETSAGNLVRGEGVMSLSRAFTYAGCPNIITSLWKADDFSTAYITKRIHKLLTDGLAIDKAVQRAKLDYLGDEKINPRLKHPYYWSHLVFVGNIDEEKSMTGWWIAGGVLLALLVVIFLRKLLS